MKKFIAGTAMCTVAGWAAAQSSLTLYGIADLSLAGYSTRSSFYNNAPDNPATQGTDTEGPVIKKRLNGMQPGGIIGIRGREDLGAGLSASFVLESDLAMDDGSRGLGPFNRRSTLSLTGGLGEIRLGRDYTATFANDALYDPALATGTGASMLARSFAALATVRGPGPGGPWGDNYVRVNNSVGYFLPRNLGGFHAVAQYAFPENPQNPAGNSGGKDESRDSKRGRYMGTRIGYAKGAWDMAIALGESMAVDSAGPLQSNQRKIATRSIGASYNFGAVKLMGEWVQVNDQLHSIGAPGASASSTTDRYRGWQVGAILPMKTGRIRASYGSVSFRNGSPSAPDSRVSSDAKNEQWYFGYEYFLSKRTALYVDVGYVHIGNGYNSPVIMGRNIGAAGFIRTGTPQTSGYAPHSSTAYNAGLRMAF